MTASSVSALAAKCLTVTCATASAHLWPVMKDLSGTRKIAAVSALLTTASAPKDNISIPKRVVACALHKSVLIHMFSTPKSVTASALNPQVTMLVRKIFIGTP